jgi:hypothetical protein
MRWWGCHATYIAAGYIFLLTLQMCVAFAIELLAFLSPGGRLDFPYAPVVILILAIAGLLVVRGSVSILIALDVLFAVLMLFILRVWWRGFRHFASAYVLSILALAVLLVTGAIISRSHGIDRHGHRDQVY